MIAQQVAAAGNRQYVDVRALLLDPVDLRGIPWRDTDGRTRWAPPVFLPPTSGDSPTEDIDKVAALEFADALLEASRNDPTGVFRSGLWVPVTAT